MLCCADFPRDLTVPPGRTIDVPVTFQTPANAKFSVPHAEHLYDENRSKLTIAVGPSTQIEGTMISLLALTSADVAPPVEIASISPSTIVITPQTETGAKTLTLNVVNHKKVSVSTSIEAIAAADKPEVKRTKINETRI